MSLPGGDGRDGGAAFLHVEQKVAALAHREVVVEARQTAQRRLQNVLAAAANVPYVDGSGAHIATDCVLPSARRSP